MSSPYMFMTLSRNKNIHTTSYIEISFFFHLNSSWTFFGFVLHVDNDLVIEPVLICQCQQIIQCQCVFLVDHLEEGNRFLNDHSLVFCNL